MFLLDRAQLHPADREYAEESCRDMRESVLSTLAPNAFWVNPRQARTPFNVTGHPALAMMAGLSQGGLPLSVQFVGPYFGEARLFQVARAWERAAGTADRHPPRA